MGNPSTPIRCEDWDWNYPNEMRDLACRRTVGFLRMCATNPISLQALVQSCYLQGMIDMADAANNGGR